MGAVSRCGLLRLPATPSLFDVEQFRGERQRRAVAREVTGPTLVLGSTQPAALVSASVLRERQVTLARRRGGGGAVYLAPGEQLWLDAWIPRDDLLWSDDVSVAAEWAGRWWVQALEGVGLAGLAVQRGRAVPGPWGDLVCFAGRGPGEVVSGDRKVVGLSQWRAREGALFSTCAYARWDPAPLLAVLGREGEEDPRRRGPSHRRDRDGPGRARSAGRGPHACRALLLSTFGQFGLSGSPAG